MSRFVRVFVWCVFGSGLIGIPGAALADPLPTISIMAADGTVGVGFSNTINLSGPGFTLDFFTEETPFNYQFNVGVSVPDFGFGPVFADPARSPGQPNGNLDVGGTTYFVAYDVHSVPITLHLLDEVIVPFGTVTVNVPAVLTANGPACLGGRPFYIMCVGPDVANVDLNVPGVLSLSFTPFAPELPTPIEQINGVFTPVPEPSTAASILFGMALSTLLWRFSPARLRSR